MFQIKNIATHNFQNGNTTLDVAAQTVCEFKHLFEIYLQSFMFQIKRDQKYCDTQLSKWKHLDCSITSQLYKVRLWINKYLQFVRENLFQVKSGDFNEQRFSIPCIVTSQVT